MRAVGKTFVRAATALAACGAPPAVVAAQPRAAQQPSARAQAAVAAHVDSARALAGTDVSPALMRVLCSDPKEAAAFIGPKLRHRTPMPPSRAFDDLYYLGLDFVGAWALKTSDGIMLFDALDNTQEARDLIEGGLRAVGLDPAQIKVIVVSHGHGDHYGGAKYLAEKYHAKVYMSAADWEYAPRWLADWTAAGGPAAAAMFGDIPTRDGVLTDGQRLTLGGTTVTFYVTPGHTPGTLSALVPVTDRGARHLLSFWGGTALPADLAGKQRYEQSAARFLRIIDSANVDGAISNHPFIDGTSEKVRQIQQRRAGDPNPFVIGRPAVLRYMGVHLQCVRAAELR